MKEGQNIWVNIPNNVISQNPTIDTITVDIYDLYGKKYNRKNYAGKFSPRPGTDSYNI
jgi:hypothetical protein